MGRVEGVFDDPRGRLVARLRGQVGALGFDVLNLCQYCCQLIVRLRRFEPTQELVGLPTIEKDVRWRRQPQMAHRIESA